MYLLRWVDRAGAVVILRATVVGPNDELDGVDQALAERAGDFGEVINFERVDARTMSDAVALVVEREHARKGYL